MPHKVAATQQAGNANGVDLRHFSFVEMTDDRIAILVELLSKARLAILQSISLVNS